MSRATDFVEAEILSIQPFHEKRVGILANRMASYMGMDDEYVYALTMAGALHDCALSEALNDEFSITGAGYQRNELDMSAHSIKGEEMLKCFPFYSKVEGAVLYHHDRADGKGALRATAAETPLSGQIVHIADMADGMFSLYTMDRDKYGRLMEWLEQDADKAFSAECAEAFRASVDYDLLESIAGDGSVRILDELVPDMWIDVPINVMRDLARFFAHITDYKSHFTWRHSIGIAEKAEKMGRFYNYSEEMCDKLYIAGALHDIGKLLIPNDILEKPGKLDNEEYKTIQNHAMGTWCMLSPIGGMEDITRWAALHHEKLDGSGYPFGLKAEDLSKEERLIACLDIYQALSEERPYKAGLPHEEAIEILRKMGRSGQLDERIIEEIDECHRGYHKEGYKAERQQEEEKQYIGDAWRCPVCGYVYEGELPGDFICPRCGQPGTGFEKIH